jgi:hypothetical protein
MSPFTNPSWLLPKMQPCSVFFEKALAMSAFMTSDTPAALSSEPDKAIPGKQATIGELGEIALTVTFTLTAVLFVSFLAVVTGLV